MKPNGKQLFAGFVTIMFVAPLLSLFFQNNSITGAVNYVDVIGGFKDTNKTVVYENDSLVIWTFGITTCTACSWEKQVLDEALKNFENVTVKNYFLDSNYDISKITPEEQLMFQEYSPNGYVPLIVIGNKYFKVGSGQQINGYEKEKQYLIQLIGSLV